MKTLSQSIGGEESRWRLKKEALESNLRVAMPGIITAFDPATCTATVQPAIREALTDQTGVRVNLALPELLDVPIIMPHGGKFSITLPVMPGDECLIIFADMCIDAWWQSGGVQNQVELRRHDLSDAFAILGPWSQATKPSYAADRLTISNGRGIDFIIKDDVVQVYGPVIFKGKVEFMDKTYHHGEQIPVEDPEEVLP